MNDRKPTRVVVTGAAGVIGEWISRAFARDGADLLLHDLRPEPLAALADDLRRSGAAVGVAHGDLSQDDGWKQLVTSIS